MYRLRLAERLAGWPKEGNSLSPPPGTSPSRRDWGGGWEESDPDSYYPPDCYQGGPKPTRTL